MSDETPQDYLTDPREMRKWIAAVVQGRAIEENDGFGPSHVSPTLHFIESIARREGWSGEDTMTALAYHAIMAWQTQYKLYFNMLCLSPTPMVVPITKFGDKP